MDPAAEVRQEIERFVEQSPLNRHPDGSGPYFEEPLVGFASADDSLFQRYKEIIGDFHLTPREFFEEEFGEGSLPGGTVISWILPVAEETRLTNRIQDELPSTRWTHTRAYGEKFNVELRRHVIAHLAGKGHRAVSPLLSARWRMLTETPVGIASTWSERHAAYAAGLGTFSLNDGLITPRGIAHRIGSVVTGLALPPTPRPYEHYRANCLFFAEQTCGACIERCPGGALSENGHDKERCRSYVHGTVMASVGKRDGIEGETGCGLCQTGVPCESRIPRGKGSRLRA